MLKYTGIAFSGSLYALNSTVFSWWSPNASAATFGTTPDPLPCLQASSGVSHGVGLTFCFVLAVVAAALA